MKSKRSNKHVELDTLPGCPVNEHIVLSVTCRMDYVFSTKSYESHSRYKGQKGTAEKEKNGGKLKMEGKKKMGENKTIPTLRRQR